MQYTEIWFFIVLFYFAQNIYRGYTLEPPRLGGSNEKPQTMFWIKNKNKRTNGPVNAHLRTGIYKIGQGHPKVMIYINFVELLSLMLHAKFQNHRPSGSGEEDFKGFFFCYL